MDLKPISKSGQTAFGGGIRLFYIAASSKDGCLDRLIVELTDAVRVDSRLEDEVYRVKGDYYIKWTPVDGRGFYSLIKE